MIFARNIQHLQTVVCVFVSFYLLFRLLFFGVEGIEGGKGLGG